MKKNRLAAVALAALMIFSAVSCNGGRPDKNSSNSSYGMSMNDTNQDKLASSEVDVSIAQEVVENETAFKVNSVIDSGHKDDDNNHFVYLNVTIKNQSSTDWELSMLNNFYLLMPDGTESHYDIRTQFYAEKNYKNYTDTPFTISAGSEFTGYIGGFLVDDGATEFSVCFFPTGADDKNKGTVIKCPVKAADMVSPPEDMIG